MKVEAELYSQPLAIVDVETTGASPLRNRVLEIAIIRIEGTKVVEVFESLIDPGCSIPESITSITGIRTHDIEAAPTFYDISQEVERLLKGALFVAHNAQFDYAFIKAEFARLEKRFTAKRLCTVALSRKLFPEYKHHDLSTIREI